MKNTFCFGIWDSDIITKGTTIHPRDVDQIPWQGIQSIMLINATHINRMVVLVRGLYLVKINVWPVLEFLQLQLA